MNDIARAIVTAEQQWSLVSVADRVAATIRAVQIAVLRCLNTRRLQRCTSNTFIQWEENDQMKFRLRVPREILNDIDNAVVGYAQHRYVAADKARRAAGEEVWSGVITSPGLMSAAVDRLRLLPQMFSLDDIRRLIWNVVYDYNYSGNDTAVANEVEELVQLVVYVFGRTAEMLLTYQQHVSTAANPTYTECPVDHARELSLLTYRRPAEQHFEGSPPRHELDHQSDDHRDDSDDPSDDDSDNDHR